MKKILIIVSLFFLFCIPVSARTVILGGDTIGIEAEYDGILVTGFFEYQDNGTMINPSSKGSVRIHDRIVGIKGSRVTEMNDLYDLFEILPKQDAVLDVMVARNKTIVPAKMHISYIDESDCFKTGLYVKDKIRGIGTLTFIDPESRRYGALGHEISEHGESEPAEINRGKITDATVQSIHKSSHGHAGEKICRRDSEKILGTISENSIYGIYGKMNSIPLNADTIETASKEEVHTGSAQMITVTSNKRIESYNIKIVKLDKNSKMAIKAITFMITDPELIRKTGGIVQGMSGSPIIQDGKLVGAVTHVLVNDPTKGYGIFIENMLETAE